MPKDLLQKENRQPVDLLKNQPVDLLSDKDNQTFESDEALRQFFIGLGNSSAFGIPELIGGEGFKNLESKNIGERISRGVGTTAGFINPFGIPATIGKVSTKLAAKGIVKVAPKLAKSVGTAGRISKSAIEGATAGAAFNLLDPNTTLEDKPENVLGGIVGGAVAGATVSAVPKMIRSFINRNKNISKSDKLALNEVTNNPSAYTPTGQRVENQTALNPSVERIIPKQAKDILDTLRVEETKIFAAKRNIIPIKDQIQMSKGIKIDQNFYDNIQPGQAVNTETFMAAKFDLIKQLGALGKTPSKEAVDTVSHNISKVNALLSETGRTLGAQSRTQTLEAEQLKFLTNQFNKLDPEAKGQAEKLFKQFQTPGFWDKFMEYRTAALLTSPFTHTRNILGNSIGRLFRIPEKVFAAGADAVNTAITRNSRSRFFSEAVYDFVGMTHGFRPAMKNAMKALMDETFVSDDRLMEAVRFRKAIPGLKGKIIRSPFRALVAMDEFYSTLSHNASLYSQAVRQAAKDGAKDIPARAAELIRNPSVDMLEKASKEALVDTFRQPLGSFGKSMQSLINKNKAMKFIIPFFRTPVNLFKWSLDRGPTSLVSPGNWNAISKGSPEAKADAVARMALSQMMSLGLYLQALDGNITGKLSDNPSKRDSLRRLGIEPYSIKLGDKYVSYRSYEPISSMLAMVANTAEIVKDRDNPLESGKATQIVAETLKMMKDQSFLRGISDVTNALDDPERYGERFIQNATTSLIPTGVGYLARLQDPVIRQPDSIPEAIKSRLPYFSKGVPARLDVWGRPITKEGSLSQRAFIPSGVTTLKPDLTEEQLISLEKFPKKINKTYKGLKLTTKERNVVTEVEGRIAKSLLDQLVKTRQYKSMAPDDQNAAIDRVLGMVRRNVRKPFARAKFMQEYTGLTNIEDKIRLLERFTNKTLFKRDE